MPTQMILLIAVVIAINTIIAGTFIYKTITLKRSVNNEM